MRFMFKAVFVICVIMGSLGLMAGSGCTETNSDVKSDSGVSKAHVDVVTGADGLTTEQRNIQRRYKLDNTPGSIKHLYVISSVSGQCLLYSTVDGKVTSSGKRLSPTTVEANHAGKDSSCAKGFPINISGRDMETAEVLQDDGTYGSSIEYLFWFDVRGVFHQQYISGDMMLHISDKPIPIKSITINIEQQALEVK